MLRVELNCPSTSYIFAISGARKVLDVGKFIVSFLVSLDTGNSYTRMRVLIIKSKKKGVLLLLTLDYSV